MDPLSLTAIGGLALAEGIKFLYGQAGELLRRRRERKTAGTPSSPPPLGLLDHEPGPLVPDADTLNRLADRLQDLRDVLEPYVLDTSRLEADRPLAQTAALREALEAIYAQRLTFQGEMREPSGTVITGTARARIVEGLLAGVRIDDLTGVDRVDGIVEVDEVPKGGQAFGVDARRRQG